MPANDESLTTLPSSMMPSRAQPSYKQSPARMYGHREAVTNRAMVQKKCMQSEAALPVMSILAHMSSYMNDTACFCIDKLPE